MTAGVKEPTLLLQVTDPAGTAVATVLLAHDVTAGGAGVALLVPGEVSVQVPAQGATTMAATTTTGSAQAGALALANVLRVRVDGAWPVSEGNLARLVDGVGGVSVAVDHTVVDGATVVPQGPTQHLDGAQAVAYLASTVSGESDAARLARVGTVLQALLTALPPHPADLLRSTGALTTATLPPGGLDALLGNLHADAVAGTLTVQDLPTTTSGGTVLVDPVAAAQVVTATLADARTGQAGGDQVSVLVQNGVGTPGLGATAQARLTKAGLAYIAGGNATTFGQPSSVVMLNDSSATSLAAGRRVLQALGLPASDLRVASQGQSVATVLVVLGGDYRG